MQKLLKVSAKYYFANDKSLILNGFRSAETFILFHQLFNYMIINLTLIYLKVTCTEYTYYNFKLKTNVSILFYLTYPSY